jgi:hypothetical protein
VSTYGEIYDNIIYIIFLDIFLALSYSKQQNYPFIFILHMNNAIMATVLIAMMFAIAATTPYVFGPSPAVIFKTTEGDSLTDSSITDVGGRRGR